LLTVIDALLVTRIVVQFIGQCVAVMLLRKQAPQMQRPYRIWLYPLPPLLALVGWLFLFATYATELKIYGLLTLLLGVVFFLLWSKWTRRWPFAVT
jgi:amino acid transporter